MPKPGCDVVFKQKLISSWLSTKSPPSYKACFVCFQFLYNRLHPTTQILIRDCTFNILNIVVMVSTQIFSLFYEEKLQISSIIIASKRLRVQCWRNQLLHQKLFECIYVKYFNLIINLSQIIGSKSHYEKT